MDSGVVEAREQSLSQEDIHNVLRNKRRRFTIEYLRENGDESQIRELSEYIAERETNETPPPRNIRNSVYVALHQTHLPKLDELGLVDYDTDRKTISLKRAATELEPYLRNATSKEFPWSMLYLGSGLAASLLIAGSVANIPGLGLLDPMISALGYATLALGLIAFELVRRRSKHVNARYRKQSTPK